MFFWHTKVLRMAPPQPHRDINPANPRCPSTPVAFTNMKTTIILLLGILALCAQLQAAPTADKDKGECRGAGVETLEHCGADWGWGPTWKEQVGAIPQHRARHIPSSGASMQH